MKIIKRTKGVFALLVILSAFAACSKMDATYVDFVKKGSVTYVGIPDSVKVYSGKNRLKLSWLITDPSTTQVKIYWRNKSDSLILPVKLEPNSNKMEVWLNDMAEGTYSFDVKMYDKNNNSSVNISVVGKVYGSTYSNTLLSRPVRSAIIRNDTVTITWGSADMTVVGTKLDYKDKEGKSHQVIVPVTTTNSEDTKIPNYSMVLQPTFTYSTLYVPDSLALDTFYTATQTIAVARPPVEYARTGWTAVETDYDTNRLPKNVLDNSSSTIWHMSKSSPAVYPHAITIDMKKVNLVHGIFYIQRTPLDGAVKLVEIQVSDDGLTWSSLGAYTFENLGNKQYLDLLEPASFRYFKIIVRSDYKNGTATALAELGTYTR